MKNMEIDETNSKKSGKKAIKSLIESWHALSYSEEENNNEEILNLLNKTEKSIRNVDWQEFRPRLRIHLTGAMEDCLRSCTSSPRLISALIESSIIDPWFHSPLEIILGNNTDPNLDHFCANVDCDVLCAQLHRLSQTNSKDFALKLCLSCMNTPRFKKNANIKEIYFTLLFQLQQIDKLSQEMLSFYACETAIEFVERLLEQSDANFAACVIQIFLVNDLLTLPAYSYTFCLTQMWVDVQFKLDGDLHLMRDKATMLSRMFSLSAHYYILMYALFGWFGSELLQVCIEMCVKGLTIDLNSLERARVEKVDVAEVEALLANNLLRLALIVGGQSMLARECYLSAFSIDPTADRLKGIGEFKGFAGSCHCIVRGSCKKDRVVDGQLDDLPDELLGDLTIVLNKPRNKLMSWELEWSELEKYCGEHLEAKLAVIVKNPVVGCVEEPMKMCKEKGRKMIKSKRQIKSVVVEKEIFNGPIVIVKSPVVTCVTKSLNICKDDERKKIKGKRRMKSEKCIFQTMDAEKN